MPRGKLWETFKFILMFFQGSFLDFDRELSAVWGCNLLLYFFSIISILRATKCYLF